MPAQLRFRPGALNQLTLDGNVIETHSSKCSHCQRLTDFPSMKTMMEHVDICRGCMKLICLECVGKPCLPAEKWAEQVELAARLKARVHRDAWGCY